MSERQKCPHCQRWIGDFEVHENCAMRQEQDRSPSYQELVARMRGMYHKLTADERLDWVYGQLAATTRHKPLRAAFANLAAEKFGWSTERFDAWARERAWS